MKISGNIQQKYSLRMLDVHTRTFIICTLGLAYFTGQAGFELGAYGQLLYERKLTAWLTVSAIFLALVVLPKDKLPFSRKSLYVLLIPSAWIGLQLFTKTIYEGEILFPPLFILGLISSLACLPYALYLIAQVMTPEFLELPGLKPKLGLGLIAVFFFLCGLFIGNHHYWFLSCHDFELNGSYVPENENCTQL
jgi:hypothetical protein